MTDPFANPVQPSSDFPSADSFRGRLILVSVTKVERNVPSKDDPSKVSDRYTCDVTTVDGQGEVRIYAYGTPVAGKAPLPGPVHKGVWFSQMRLVDALEAAHKAGTMVLARLDTYKPGQRAGKGNPWGWIDPTEADKQMARDFLATQVMAQARAAVDASVPAPAVPVPAANVNPFANHPATPQGEAPF